ncbi:MAG: glutamate--cysteine ligase [Deltaproteobacteria bacterium]|nr:glutamate--cysteine ligase [Deltaproteobacteria bacterium]
MSEFQAGSEPGSLDPIADTNELVAYIRAGAKPRSEWRVGTEYEKVGVLRETGAAAPFSGPNGIERVLAGLAERYGWTPKLDRGRIIALYGRQANITVEPGGQLELSGEQCESIHCAQDELLAHVREILTVSEGLGIVFLGLGIQPLSGVDDIEWVPKRRYEIMGPYMRRVGTLGQRMMKQTATVQANFDFGDERDAIEKLRVAMGLVPLVSAMFANSSVSEGRLNGFMTLRGHIWTDTDPARSGMLPFVFNPNCGIDDYVEYALDVPMYFIIRGGEYIEATAVTFREFMGKGYRGQRATLDDWALHLTTLFPEVRLKRYLEVRSADSQPPEMMLALPALMKGVLYESDSLGAAWDLVRRWTWEERVALYHEAHRHGLKAKIRGIGLDELGRELIAIAAGGLVRQRRLNANGEDERVYLDPLEELVRHGKSQGRLLAERWAGEWHQDMQKLIAHTSYRFPIAA